MENPGSFQSPLIDSLHILFKRQRSILIIFLVTVCVVATGTFLTQPTYEVMAQILVKVGRQNVYTPPNSTTSQVVNFDKADQINSEIQLIRSRALIEKVLAAIGPEVVYPDLDGTLAGFIRKIKRVHAASPLENAALQFEKALTVEAVRDSDVITISLQHTDPDIAARAVNGLAEVYLDEHITIHTMHQSHTFFKEQSQTLKDKLEQAEQELESIKKEHQVTSLVEQQKLLLSRISALRYELNHTASNLSETGVRVSQLQNQLERTPATIAESAETVQNSALISNLESRLIELQLKQKELSSKYTPRNRLVIQVIEELAVVEDKLAEYEAKKFEKNVIGVNRTFQHLKEELLRNQSDLEALSAKKRVQQGQLEEYQLNLARLNQLEVTLNQLQQQVDVDRRNYLLYLDKFEESRILESMNQNKMNNVILMKSALPPIEPIKPKVLLNLILGFFLGVFGGVAYAFVSDYLDDSLEKPEDVENQLGLPFITSIPEMPSLAGRLPSRAVVSDVKLRV